MSQYFGTRITIRSTPRKASNTSGRLIKIWEYESGRKRRSVEVHHPKNITDYQRKNTARKFINFSCLDTMISD
ncbi:uncharacterized protein EAF01_009520 [Botrytis porri]|uniref:uncharacterized protein n=1 Tax=Botrytis porri TaxID=87229 RepID=UPI001901161D|nr:uncharacterized protein EAF01_009520 [Botrytis porri]KAF7895558.1 hypothetical protein EAF01_009520 [Botrytis porri]